MAKEQQKKPPAGSKFSPRGDNAYTDAQLVDIGLLEREQRHATSWRRAFFVSIALLLLPLLTALVLATKDHTEGLVYKEDRSGDIALIGMTSQNRIPSDRAVIHQLTLWIQAVRDIPAQGDNQLVNRNATLALYMINQNSPALEDYKNFVRTNNPITLARQGYRRTVGNVEVDKLTDLTYRIAWQESLSSGNAAPSNSSFTGTVTLATLPKVPDDPLIGQYNPAGVILQQYDMRWSTLR